MGVFRTVVDTYGQQSVVGPYGLLLRGLCFRVDEQWAPSFTLPINTWAGITLPSTTWTGISLPTTTWTPA